MERHAVALRDARNRWLEITQIAVPAVLEAAAGGNVICKAAAVKMAALLPNVVKGGRNE